MDLTLIISSVFILSLLIFLQKKLSFVVDNPYDSIHKKKIYSGVPLSGGLFFLIFILMFNDKLNIDFELIILITSLTIVGLFSDGIKNFKPIHRLILQILILLIYLTFTGVKINSSNLFFLDLLLKNNIFNLFFTIFCISILINGSNFCDGININVSGYYLILLLCIYFISRDLSLNLDLYYLVYPLIIFVIFNFFSYCFLGDNGSYLLSVLFGIFLIEFINTNSQVSPFFAILALWYPCFENLFTIIRRKKKNFNSMKPDRRHLHHKLLNYITINYFINNKKLANSFTGITILIYNSISMFFGFIFFNSSLILGIIVIFNISIYLTLFNLLDEKH